MEGLKNLLMLHQCLSIILILSTISSNDCFSINGFLARKASLLSMTATQQPLLKVSEDFRVANYSFTIKYPAFANIFGEVMETTEFLSVIYIYV